MKKSVIYKRDDSKSIFNQSIITETIIKVMESIDEVDEQLAIKLTDKIINKVSSDISVEGIQDLIDITFREQGLTKLLQSFNAYRNHRADARETKRLLGINDELKLTSNALKLLDSHYLREDESTSDLFNRVAESAASVELKPDSWSKQFYDIMSNLEFLPNSPALMNAGLSNRVIACFGLPINDSLKSIFGILKTTVLIHQSGGGTGFNFSKLRPEGDVIKSGGVASGPLSFISVYDKTTEVIKKGGKKRGANMALLNHDHPDLIKFINAQGLRNFNRSVCLTDSFMKKVISDSDYWLINPRNNKRTIKVSAREIFNLIVSNAWSSGEPGIIFIDEVNKHHGLKNNVDVVSSCGEQPLMNYESCPLGSINLSLMIKDGRINWGRLEYVTRLGVRFLDNLIDLNDYPNNKIKKVSLNNRKIGLGVMGFAEMLIKLGVPYDSKDCLSIADKLMQFIKEKALDESRKIGLEKGSFPEFKKTKLSKKYKHMRNATVTTISPTGSISVIADCSPSIEPLFSVIYHKKLLGNNELVINKLFEQELIRKGLYSDDFITTIANEGVESKKLPAKIRNLFRTAMQIKPEWHVKVQSVFQKHVDNAISKTVNLPNNASIDDVADVFMLAYKLKCKGITIYRDKSLSEQIINYS